MAFLCAGYVLVALLLGELLWPEYTDVTSNVEKQNSAPRTSESRLPNFYGRRLNADELKQGEFEGTNLEAESLLVNGDQSFSPSDSPPVQPLETADDDKKDADPESKKQPPFSHLLLRCGLSLLAIASLVLGSGVHGVFRCLQRILNVNKVRLIYCHRLIGLSGYLVAILAVYFTVAALDYSLMTYRNGWFLGSAISVALLFLSVRFCIPAASAMLELNRIEYSHPSPDTFKASKSSRLLPYQSETIGELREMLLGDRGRPLQITLRGGWGSGKSTILHNLTRVRDRVPYDLHALRKRYSAAQTAHDSTAEIHDSAERPPNFPERPRLVVCVLNAWRYTDPKTVEHQLVADVFRNRQVLRMGGWRIRSPWSPNPRFVPYVMSIVAKLRLRREDDLGSADIFHPPQIRYRQQLKSVASLVREKGAELVLVIDEVDRCEPQVVQTLLTVVNRSINIPQLAIVTAVVEEQLHVKAFDPLRIQVGDLRSTVLTDLHEFLLNNHPDAGLHRSEIERNLANVYSIGPSSDHDDRHAPRDSAGTNPLALDPTNDDAVPVQPTGGTHLHCGPASSPEGLIKLPDGLSPQETATYLGQFVVESYLVQKFVSLPTADRRQLYQHFSRRYLPQVNIPLTYLDYPNLALKLFDHEVTKLRKALIRHFRPGTLFAHPEFGNDFQNQWVECTRGLDVFNDFVRPPSLRDLEAEGTRFFREAVGTLQQTQWPFADLGQDQEGEYSVDRVRQLVISILFELCARNDRALAVH